MEQSRFIWTPETVKVTQPKKGDEREEREPRALEGKKAVQSTPLKD